MKDQSVAIFIKNTKKIAPQVCTAGIRVHGSQVQLGKAMYTVQPGTGRYRQKIMPSDGCRIEAKGGRMGSILLYTRMPEI